MVRLTEAQARQEVADHGLDWEDRAEVVRYCAECGYWVLVDDYCGDKDHCDDCG